MGAGLGSLSAGNTAYMVIRFTGEITKADAKAFNDKLNEMLAAIQRGEGGGTGNVSANNAVQVTSTF